MRRTDHFSRGVLPNVVCLNVIVKTRPCGGHGPLGAVAPICVKYVINDLRLTSMIIGDFHGKRHTEACIFLMGQNKLHIS